MLEFIVVFYLCKRNVANAKARGRKAGGAIAYTIGLWLGFEITGVVVGFVIGFFLGIEGTFIMYILALAFAALGGFISNLISKAGPVIVQPDPAMYYPPPFIPYPNQQQNPYQCLRCGNINTSDSLFCMKCGSPLQVNQPPEQENIIQ